MSVQGNMEAKFEKFQSEVVVCSQICQQSMSYGGQDFWDTVYKCAATVKSFCGLLDTAFSESSE